MRRITKVLVATEDGRPRLKVCTVCGVIVDENRMCGCGKHRCGCDRWRLADGPAVTNLEYLRLMAAARSGDGCRVVQTVRNGLDVCWLEIA